MADELSYFPGTKVIVFDPSRYKDDIRTPLSVILRPAIVVKWYG